MARIRTIKPSFFRHEELFEAEQETKLPLRVAFAGLWTAADREGRFRWSPRALKLDCLPFDDVDFSRVLDALTTRGFIVRYAVDDVEYGAIPAWSKHQIVNNRESASDIPKPPEISELTRAARVEHASSTPLKRVQGEGKGKEQEGKGDSELRSDERATRRETSAPNDPDFDRFWEAYPQRDGANPKAPAAKKFAALVRTGVPAETMIQGALQAADAARKRGDFGSRFIPTAIVWLNQQRWADAAAELFQATNRSPHERSHHDRSAGAAARPQTSGDATLAGLGKIAGRIRERGMAERQADFSAAGGDDPGRADPTGGPETRGELLALPRPHAAELGGCRSGDALDRGEADAGSTGPEGDGGQRGGERRGVHGGLG